MPYKPHRTRGMHQVAETNYLSPGVLPTEHSPPIARYSPDKSYDCTWPKAAGRRRQQSIGTPRPRRAVTGQKQPCTKNTF